MLKSETLKILTRMWHCGAPEPDQLAVEIWHDLIGDLDFRLAEAAVIAHYRESPYRIKASEVIERVEAMSKTAHFELARRELQESQRRELLDHFDADGRGLGTDELSAALWWRSGPASEVEAKRDVVRKHNREWQELEAAHGTAVESVSNGSVASRMALVSALSP